MWHFCFYTCLLLLRWSYCHFQTPVKVSHLIRKMTDVFPNCKLWRDDHSDFKDSDFDGNQQLTGVWKWQYDHPNWKYLMLISLKIWSVSSKFQWQTWIFTQIKVKELVPRQLQQHWQPEMAVEMRNTYICETGHREQWNSNGKSGVYDHKELEETVGKGLWQPETHSSVRPCLNKNLRLEFGILILSVIVPDILAILVLLSIMLFPVCCHYSFELETFPLNLPWLKTVLLQLQLHQYLFCS